MKGCVSPPIGFLGWHRRRRPRGAPVANSRTFLVPLPSFTHVVFEKAASAKERLFVSLLLYAWRWFGGLEAGLKDVARFSRR